MGRPHSLIAGAVAAGGCVGLLFVFAEVDFYNTQFFNHGGAVTLYNLLRLVFVALISWLVYAPGVGVLRIFADAELAVLSPLERYALGFFTGAALWHVALFAIGLVGEDTKPIVICLTLAVVFLSAPHLGSCFAAAVRVVDGAVGRGTPHRARNLACSSVLIVVAGLFLLVKGIYPGGGHDYYDHYFYYYINVIKSGSIMPNEAWYHFYYSKGAGLFFLAMLLSDPLAPQLVTTAFIATGAVTVAAIAQRLAPRTALPLVAALLYLALLIYTPGPNYLIQNTGWAQLEGIHEPVSVTFLGLFWISTRFDAVGRERRLWLLGAAAAAVTIALLTVEMMAFVEGFLGLLFLWGMARRQWRIAAAAFYTGAVAGTTMVALLAVNYWATGIPLDRGIVFFWPIVDLDRVNRLGVLNEVLWLHINASQLQMSPVFDIAARRLLFLSLRLDLWWPLFALGAAGLIWAAVNGAWRGRVAAPAMRATWLSVLAFLLSFMMVGFGLGVSQGNPVSFYRFSSFAYAPTLCSALALCAAYPILTPAGSERWGSVFIEWTTGGDWFLALRLPMPHPARIWRVLAVAIIATVAITGLRGQRERFLAAGIGATTENAARFLVGDFSIKDAYQHSGWPSQLPWGAIYPAMEQVWKIVGRGTPIYSFHAHSYCMLPDCRVLEWMSTRTFPRFQTLLLGTTEEAIAAIKSAGIEYFFYSKELGAKGLGITSPIVAAPIFAPDQIGRYFGIKWTDGTSYLLTWRDRSARPLSDEFLDAYREQVGPKPSGYFPVKLWSAVFATFHEWGLHPYRLPWCLTCPGLDLPGG